MVAAQRCRDKWQGCPMGTDVEIQRSGGTGPLSGSAGARPASSAAISDGSGNQRRPSTSGGSRGLAAVVRPCRPFDGRRHQGIRLLQVAGQHARRRAVPPSLELEAAVPVADVVEAGHVDGRQIRVPPAAGVGVEPVVGQQFPAVVGDPADGIEDEGEDLLGQEIVEVDPHPARLDAFAAVQDGLLEPLGQRAVDAQQPVTVRAGAGTAAAGLDAEQVVQQGDDEVVMQVAFPVADGERHDGQPPGLEIAEQVDLGMGRPAVDGPADERLLALADQIGADRLLELENQPGPDRFDDRRGAPLLAVRRVTDVAVLVFRSRRPPCRRPAGPEPGWSAGPS